MNGDPFAHEIVERMRMAGRDWIHICRVSGAKRVWSPEREQGKRVATDLSWL